MINQRLFPLMKYFHHSIFAYNHCHIRSNHTFSKVEKGINNQIKAEHEASQTYLKLAVNFLHPCVSRPGIGGYFMRLHSEEIIHMHRLIHYQLTRGGCPVIGDIPEPKIQCDDSVCQAFELALQLEIEVTTLLKGLVKVAESEGDYHCVDFITKFLFDQIQSTNELQNYLTNLRRISDNEHALYYFDNELLKRFPMDVIEKE